MYIHELPEWPASSWREELVAPRATEVRLRQGKLIGRLEALGVPRAGEAVLANLTADVVKSSAIEGERLATDQVRSSIARKLGIEAAGLVPSDRRVDGVVEMALDATRNFRQPLSKERLFGWHAGLFPEEGARIRTGVWRDDAKGPMQVVSGAVGAERVHYEAPAADRLETEMAAFLSWANAPTEPDPLVVAAKAHFWFVTIHPFDDGNGRIARAIADWALARSGSSPDRYYSMSSQIESERADYYDILERTQKGGLEVSDWMLWFLDCLERAIQGSESALERVLAKDRFWSANSGLALNERQRAILNRLLDGGFEGKLTSSKWAKLAKCSHDTALRDIAALVEFGILSKDPAGGRSTSYSLKAPA